MCAMKKYIRSVVIMAVILFLFTGIVSAIETGNANKDNKSIPINTSLETPSVSKPLLSNQSDFERVKKTFSPQLQRDIDEQMGYNESINTAIAKKEQQLHTSPLKINDRNDVTMKAHGFSVGDRPSSTQVTSGKAGSAQTMVSSGTDDLSANKIPTEGFIEFGSDGRTRVFAADGTQLSYAVDNNTENVQTPSGKVLPATHIIDIPDKATI